MKRRRGQRAGHHRSKTLRKRHTWFQDLSDTKPIQRVTIGLAERLAERLVIQLIEPWLPTIWA